MLQNFALNFFAFLIAFAFLPGSATAQSQNAKYACEESNPAQMCVAANTCGSASSPCSVDVKRTANAASSTPGIPNAKGNSLFCVNVGTTVVWKSSNKGDGFIIDVGPSSPFDPTGPITGGSARAVSVVAKRPGCVKYAVSACHSGETYGMCGSSNAVLIIIDKK